MPQDPQKEYDNLVKTMEARGLAKASKMFGMPCLKTDKGKAFVGYYKGDVTFKLPQEIVQAWLKQKDTKLFDPANMGRPMKEWLVLPVHYANHWTELAQEALDYVKCTTK